MAIKIKTLTVKNFMSIGNVSQAVNFEQQKLTLVLGENLDQGGTDAGSRNGTGKSQPLSANILTPSGWKKMGDISVGDKVFAADGTESTVTGVFPQGVLKTFKVTFEDGRSTRASADHLWKVYSNRWFKKGDLSAKEKIITTAEIAEKLTKYRLPNGKNNSCAYVYAPLPAQIEFCDKDLLIDPWLLGFLLGDGCISTNCGIGFSSADQELIDKATSIIKNTLKLNVSKSHGKYDYNIKGLDKGTIHPLRNLLKNYNLNGCISHQKFIPQEYKNSSIQTRLSVLQGLFDTDGTVDRKTGTPSFTSTSYKLATDVAYIIRSLGGIAKISTKISKNLNHSTSYTVSVRTNFSKDLFSLTRKRILVKENYQYKNRLRNKFVSITPDVDEECQCIMIDHPDKLYITDDFVVTHNTTIVNALSYALYGQALTNIKKDNLINKINGKNMLVTLTFDKDGTEYRIERGRKPNILKFFINNQEQEVVEDNAQGDGRDTQKDIVELLNMSHNMFKHLVALNTYTEPFLSMKASEQREIIEQLLGITVLSEKAELLSKQIKETKDKITQETANIEAAKRSNEKIEQSISSLKTKQTLWIKQHQESCERLLSNIEDLSKVDIEKEILLHGEIKDILANNEKIKQTTKQKAMLETAIITTDQEIKKYQNEIALLESNRCPACEQELLDHQHTKMIETAKNILNNKLSARENLHVEYTDIVNELNALGDTKPLPETFYENVEDALRHQNNLTVLVDTYDQKINDQDPYQEQIDELSNSALQTIDWSNINELTELKNHQDFLQKLLTNKDSFIRKKLIDQNLSYLNTRLSYYLDKLGLPHIVKFINDLSVEITYLGQDLDFDNLSRGERNRLILGLSWSFRDVWESLYQNINLMFIDELIDNGLDTVGVENALSTLKKMCRERNKNVFLISHKEELIGRVNNVLKVVKENGYTTYDTSLEYYDND